VKFDPDSFILGVDHAECMAAKTVHVAEGIRNTTVTHDNGHLMQRLG